MNHYREESTVEKQIIKHTFSVCPKCLNRIPAVLTQKDGTVFMERSARFMENFHPLYGGKSLWRNGAAGKMLIWRSRHHKLPAGMWICKNHKRNTCCILLEVTEDATWTAVTALPMRGKKKIKGL